jgi:hypothetical protein
VAFLRRAPLLLFFAGAGCSLALDTDSLQSGAATSGPDHDAGSVPESSAPADATDALDAPSCPEPGPDPCSQCQAAKCCPQSSDCTRETRCNLALVALGQCRRDARLGDNTRTALAACDAAFSQNGGTRATAVLSCMAANCMTSCGGG